MWLSCRIIINDVKMEVKSEGVSPRMIANNLNPSNPIHPGEMGNGSGVRAVLCG